MGKGKATKFNIKSFFFVSILQPDKDSHEYGPEGDAIVGKTLPMINRTIIYLLEQVKNYGLTDDLNIIITR